MVLNKNSIVCQSNEIDATDIDGEKVMMNLEEGQYFSLNTVGSRIWDIISEKKSINDIVATLLNEYEVDEDECERSVIEYLEILKDADLINILS